uniref:Class I SAM-dependent methyltransferase n=1 Tax=Panagrellus redivivus TaxID=6233 RepID=A0A7E4W849_PANRE
MVVVKTATASAYAHINSELHMESGRVLRYVAPQSLNANLSDHQQVALLAQEKRQLFGDAADESEKWAGVNDLCCALDNIVEIDHETDLFKGKSILEVGFTSGLPAAYALQHQAASATLFCHDKTQMESFVKPTMRRNNIRNNIKFITCDIEDLKEKLKGQKFDIILAPELVNTDQKYYEQIYEMLEAALTDNGIIFFSGRTHYRHCDGNMPAMLDLVKSKNQFDAIDRLCGQRVDTTPWKVVQLIRKMR